MKINPLIVIRKEFDGSGVLFDPDTGEIFGLNPIAILIWECLEQGLNEEETLSIIRDKSSDTPPQAMEEMKIFIEKLRKKGFITTP